MCQRITCSECQKPSFVGCGRHVEQVLGDVPVQDRCKCREQPQERDPSRDTAAKKRWGFF